MTLSIFIYNFNEYGIKKGYFKIKFAIIHNSISFYTVFDSIFYPFKTCLIIPFLLSIMTNSSQNL